MRITVVFAVVAWGLLCSGCALVEDTGRNLALSVARPVEESLECLRNRRWAHEAWLEISSGSDLSDHYGKGFREGFENYLFTGCGETPLVAPPCYRSIAYQTPDGHQAVQDWFEGYRHGVLDAKERGLRQWVTGPSSLRVAPVADSMPEGCETPRYIMGMPYVEARPSRPIATLGQAQ